MVVYDDVDVSEKIRIYDKGISIIKDPEVQRQMRSAYRVGDMRAPKLDGREALGVMAQHANECFTKGVAPITAGESRPPGRAPPRIRRSVRPQRRPDHPLSKEQEWFRFSICKAQDRAIKTEVDPAVIDVLESGAYVLGPAVQRFEAAFARNCEARACDRLQLRHRGPASRAARRRHRPGRRGHHRRR